MQVYVVTGGIDYEGTEVLKVCYTQEKAEECIVAYTENGVLDPEVTWKEGGYYDHWDWYDWTEWVLE